MMKLTRPADKLGPKSIFVVLLKKEILKGLVLSRTQKNFRVENAIEMPINNNDLQEVAKKLKKEVIDSKYLAIISKNSDNVLRIMNFPGIVPAKAQLEKQINESLGEGNDIILKWQIESEDKESKNGHFSVLATGIHKPLIAEYDKFSESLGLKQISLSECGITLDNFGIRSGMIQENLPQAVLYIDVNDSELQLYNGDEFVMSRHFKFGKLNIIKQLQKVMGLDYEMAEDMCTTGALDMGSTIGPVINPWLHQLKISVDFFERRLGSSIKLLTILGPGASLKVLQVSLSNFINCEIQEAVKEIDFQNVKINKKINMTGDIDKYLMLSEGIRIFEEAMNETV